jgi:hypothetical protein
MDNKYMTINLETGRYIDLISNYPPSPHLFGHRGIVDIHRNLIIFNQFESTADFMIEKWYEDKFIREYKFKIRSGLLYLAKDNYIEKYINLKYIKNNNIIIFNKMNTIYKYKKLYLGLKIKKIIKYFYNMIKKIFNKCL